MEQNKQIIPKPIKANAQIVSVSIINTYFFILTLIREIISNITAEATIDVI